ncbi:MAG: hypothetical protein VKN56_01940 [Cyanobacteriota bacterium]|nr:hypothetical protein [Cyanobacteriota bacterium]
MTPETAANTPPERLAPPAERLLERRPGGLRGALERGLERELGLALRGGEEGTVATINRPCF